MSQSPCRWLPFRACSILIMSMAAGGAALAPSTNQVPLRFAFDYPTNAMSTNLVFVLHGTASVGQPLDKWGVDANLPATRWYSNGVCTAPISGTNYVLTFTNTFPVAERFLYVTASNIWYDSDASNVIALDPPPSRVNTLKAELAK